MGAVRFRRLFIDRTRDVIVAETGKDVYLYWPGAYNPDALFDDIKRIGRLTPEKWRPWPPEKTST